MQNIESRIPVLTQQFYNNYISCFGISSSFTLFARKANNNKIPDAIASMIMTGLYEFIYFSERLNKKGPSALPITDQLSTKPEIFPRFLSP